MSPSIIIEELVFCQVFLEFFFFHGKRGLVLTRKIAPPPPLHKTNILTLPGGGKGWGNNSLFSLQRKEYLKKQGITHILSAYRPSVEPKISSLQPPTDDNDYNDDGIGGEKSKDSSQLKRMLVEIEDSGSENIIKHFPKCNAFIQDGLDAGGAVLVHW